MVFPRGHEGYGGGNQFFAELSSVNPGEIHLKMKILLVTNGDFRTM